MHAEGGEAVLRIAPPPEVGMIFYSRLPSDAGHDGPGAGDPRPCQERVPSLTGATDLDKDASLPIQDRVAPARHKADQVHERKILALCVKL